VFTARYELNLYNSRPSQSLKLPIPKRCNCLWCSKLSRIWVRNHQTLAWTINVEAAHNSKTARRHGITTQTKYRNLPLICTKQIGKTCFQPATTLLHWRRRQNILVINQTTMHYNPEEGSVALRHVNLCLVKTLHSGLSYHVWSHRKVTQ
jgi:hypothetical protein